VKIYTVSRGYDYEGGTPLHRAHPTMAGAKAFVEGAIGRTLNWEPTARYALDDARQWVGMLPKDLRRTPFGDFVAIHEIEVPE